jgi:hypothetical protein
MANKMLNMDTNYATLHWRPLSQRYVFKNMNESQLITIATYSFPHEAHVAKASLDVADIPAFIADEHTINMGWLYSNVLGGVRLKVPAQDAEKAQEILSRDFSHFLEEQFDEEIETKCSKCGIKNMKSYTKGKKPAFLVFLLLGFPFFLSTW